MASVLVTGGAGFVGSAVINSLQSLGVPVVATVRDQTLEMPGHVKKIVIQNIDSMTDWTESLAGVSCVVHCAARAHIMKDELSDPLAEYRRVNVEGTINLSRQAAAVGVKRFVFISSIKVNGEQTPRGKPFTALDTPAPEDAYGLSKWEAEQALQEISSETGMEVVIIRPPLVYGSGVKGNFASMIKIVAMGIPLPLGAIRNQRSLVALDNLVDLITTCIDHPSAANQVFLAGDGQDFSTTELLRGVAGAMGKPSRLIPIPSSFLLLGAMLFGRKSLAQRLFGSLQVDISQAVDLLGWTPPISVEEGLRRCFISSGSLCVNGDECVSPKGKK